MVNDDRRVEAVREVLARVRDGEDANARWADCELSFTWEVLKEIGTGVTSSRTLKGKVSRDARTPWRGGIDHKPADGYLEFVERAFKAAEASQELAAPKAADPD